MTQCLSHANSLKLLNHSLFFLSILTIVPSPSIPMINVISSNGSNYAGSVVTMKCVSTLQSSDLFNGELTAEFTWKKNGEDVDDADSRVTISPLPENGLTFSSQLMLSPASSVVDSGSYTCEVKTTSSQYSSKVIESDTTELVVEGVCNNKYCFVNILSTECMYMYVQYVCIIMYIVHVCIYVCIYVHVCAVCTMYV